MKGNKTLSPLIGLIIFGLLTTSVSAVTMNITETPNADVSSLGNPQVFEYYLGSMTIDGDLEEPCSVDINCVNNKFNNIEYPPYSSGDTIKLTADYEIFKDNMSSWDEGPNGPGLPEAIHPNCLEQWVFKIIVQEYDGQKWLPIERKTEQTQDIPGESPEERLSVVAPSKVVANSDFEVLVLFHGDPTYKDWGIPEVITMDGDEYIADAETGAATLNAPNQTGDFLIEAEKNWHGEWGSPEDLFTYGETMTSVVDSIAADQLVVYASSSALEGESFEVLVKADGSAIEGATVAIDGQSYTTNANGVATLDTPSISQNTDFVISVSKSGYTSETAEIEVLYDPDVEDNSGDSGTVTLEFSLDRDQFWDDYPMRLRFKLECTQGIWRWNNHPHWYDDNGWDSDYGDLKVYTTNEAPTNVEFTGPSTGKVGKPIQFRVKATDPDGDKIRYWFDWDGDGIAWEIDSTGYYDSGTEVIVTYTYDEAYEGDINVCAEDGLGGETWDTISIKVSKSRTRDLPINNLLSRLSNNFSLLVQLLEKLMDLL